jgi:large conductance mechanosensitive channel
MTVLKEFREFINKGNVVDLAVAVVIGGAFGKIVSALVADLVMPLVNAVVPQGDWRKWEVTPLHFRIGDFLGTVVDFAIVAFVVFIVMVKIVGTVNKKTVATKQCPECLETVPLAAKRCRACTSVLPAIALVLALASPAAASAQTNPTFAFAKPEQLKADAPPPPPVEWKAQAKAGMTRHRTTRRPISTTTPRPSTRATTASAWPVQRHAGHRQAGPDDHAVEAPEHRAWLHAALRPEPRSAARPARLTGRQHVSG